MQQRVRVDLDVLIDDEFLPRQPDAVVRDEGELECLLRIRHVHHDPGLRPPEVFHVGLQHGKWYEPPVHVAVLSLGAADGDWRSMRDLPRAVGGAHDAGYPQLAGDDRGMAIVDNYRSK